jgi:putative acetyltransferase
MMARVSSHFAITIRPYASTDADRTLDVFVEAVTRTAAADYTPEQVEVWARPDDRRIEEWDQDRLRVDTFVAVIDECVAGFSDVSAGGYIDMMFVSPRHGRRGVGHALMTFLEQRALAAGADQMSADVSLTARRFFEAHGFVVEVEQHPVIDGVQMTSFHMTKPLGTG